MPGTRAGGQQAAETNRLRYGDDFYKNIGRAGGAKSRTGGFYADREAASKYGRIGGQKSRRGV